MMHSIHCRDKEVEIEIGIIPHSAGVNDFKDSEVEIAVISKDRAFTFVSYCSRQELEKLLQSGEEVLTELDRQEAERIFKTVNRAS